jgi:hypothetical protein
MQIFLDRLEAVSRELGSEPGQVGYSEVVSNPLGEAEEGDAR